MSGVCYLGMEEEVDLWVVPMFWELESVEDLDLITKGIPADDGMSEGIRG